MKKIRIIVDDILSIQQFYPDDLPSDWYLDYYLNEFASLYINSHLLSKMDMDMPEVVEVLEERETPYKLFLDEDGVDFDVSKISNVNVIKLPNSDKQGVDATEVILVDLAEILNIKEMNTFVQTRINKNKEIMSVIKIATPCSYNQLNELQTLIDLNF